MERAMTTETATTITVTLPPPPMALSKNGRVHWRLRSRLYREHRHWAAVTLSAAYPGQPWPAAVLDVVWRFSGHRPDDDNAWARIAAYRDGVQDAGIVRDDRDIRSGTMEFIRVPRAEQGCTITLRRSE